MYILLNFVTCGIYSFYFIYDIAKDINEICREDGKQTRGLLAYIGFSIITCGIYGIVWEYGFAQRLYDNAPRYGRQFSETGVTVILWVLLGSCLCGIGPFVAMYIMIKNLNELAKAYNERKINEYSAR